MGGETECQQDGSVGRRFGDRGDLAAGFPERIAAGVAIEHDIDGGAGASAVPGGSGEKAGVERVDGVDPVGDREGVAAGENQGANCEGRGKAVAEIDDGVAGDVQRADREAVPVECERAGVESQFAGEVDIGVLHGFSKARGALADRDSCLIEGFHLSPQRLDRILSRALESG